MANTKAIAFGISLFFTIWTLVGAILTEPILLLMLSTLFASISLSVGLSMGESNG